MSTVLLVGEDQILLRTRAAVVRTTGAATLCSDQSSALAVLRKHPCELVILCHTLRPELRSSIAGAIHSHWPDTSILLLSSAREWDLRENTESSDAICSVEPEHLVLCTVELLKRKGPRSEKRPASNRIKSASC